MDLISSIFKVGNAIKWRFCDEMEISDGKKYELKQVKVSCISQRPVLSVPLSTPPLDTKALLIGNEAVQLYGKELPLQKDNLSRLQRNKK